MRNFPISLIILLFLAATIGVIHFTSMPQHIPLNVPETRFSTDRALEHVRRISQKPHFTGSAAHREVRTYIQEELAKMGLPSEIQKGYQLSRTGVLVYCHNIISRIPGSKPTKSLLLLAHYDSAPHSKSPGAADDAVGVATILEGIRAFKNAHNTPDNDIVILFSDAEEIGLLGARLFVEKHPLARNVGMVLNFEARGTAGPSYMLMETNSGNSEMTRNFAEAGVAFPNGNSLMYNIYKKMPNDTDLTIFRKSANIPGFNFAFIDDHFNYHTEQDNVNNLDKRSLAHQGAYLMPLLKHFATTDLNSFESHEDDVYFSLPFTFIHYPESWNLPAVIVATLLFAVLLFIGCAKRVLHFREILASVLRFIAFLVVTGVLIWGLWRIVLLIYPEYKLISQGFTYNGHWYIAAAIALALSVGFAFYQSKTSESQIMNQYLGPLLFLLIVNLYVVTYLPGAGFLIIPMFCGLISLAGFILSQRISQLFNLLLSIPILCIFYPFVTALPIGLGLKFLFLSAILTAMIFSLLLPVFAGLRERRRYSLGLLLIFIIFMGVAHFKSGFKTQSAQPHSLVYLQNEISRQTLWLSYENKPDEWTSKFLGNAPKPIGEKYDLPLTSKYGNRFQMSSPAPKFDLPVPSINKLSDSVVKGIRHVKLAIIPNRTVHRYDLFLPVSASPRSISANGFELKEGPSTKQSSRWLSYYVTESMPLELELTFSDGEPMNLQLLESAFDLTENPVFRIPERPETYIPKPFVLNDATLILVSIDPNVLPLTSIETLIQ